MGDEFGPQGVDEVLPWHLTIWLEYFLNKKIHLLQEEMSHPPARALTWICRNVAERSKKMVFLPFVTSKAEWFESEWKHGGADVLHGEGLEQMRTSRLEKSSLSTNLVEVTLKTKLL